MWLLGLWSLAFKESNMCEPKCTECKCKEKTVAEKYKDMADKFVKWKENRKDDDSIYAPFPKKGGEL